MEDYLRSALGIAVLLCIGIAFSTNRRAINWPLIGSGIALQIFFGLLVMKVRLVADAFHALSRGFVIFLNFTQAGAQFLFGDLATSSGEKSLGFIFAFQILPTVIFFSTVSAGLYYLGILQKVVFAIAWIMAKTMRLSGAESLAAAGNIFLGQTEAPLLVRPFVPYMTYSELMCLMTGGMATIAGGVLAAYVSFLGGDDPAQKALYAAHLLSASLMNAPAGIVFAKILVPETQPENINRTLEISREHVGVNLIDALSNGAAEGLKLALNIGGMLLAFIALIAMINYLLGELIGSFLGINSFIAQSTDGNFDKLSLEYILGQIFRPIAFVIGVEWRDSLQVGSLLGQKTAINEFVAYLSLAKMKNAGLLTSKSVLIATFALCGFSNFSSIAIQIGGIGSIAPNQQGNLSRLGFRALLGASLACLMTAALAGAIAS
ncbi:MAG: nucleoside transporter C-terminal domain-containing protein [Cytophagales bacterium]|nr:NupC/NupG family nucleoside CNT transporter [Bernardetiaceae bacterium]MDW8209473.1 nucleoside transporter C-terminal domain-containing protein [Cytophagales bacterium]